MPNNRGAHVPNVPDSLRSEDPASGASMEPVGIPGRRSRLLFHNQIREELPLGQNHVTAREDRGEVCCGIDPSTRTLTPWWAQAPGFRPG